LKVKCVVALIIFSGVVFLAAILVSNRRTDKLRRDTQASRDLVFLYNLVAAYTYDRNDRIVPKFNSDDDFTIFRFYLEEHPENSRVLHDIKATGIRYAVCEQAVSKDITRLSDKQPFMEARTTGAAQPFAEITVGRKLVFTHEK
jgi:hypothetical protein